jgi:flagella basal body P-ring formation protein FlgA
MIPIAIWMATVLGVSPSITAPTITSCHAVDGDHITAADLGRVWPEFAAIAPQAVIGYSPQPGANRTFEPAELARFAAAHGLEFHGTETACFELALAELDPSRIQASIRESLTGMEATSADVEVIEYSRFRVPSGKLRFPIESLPAYAPANTAIWNGFVEHENRRYPVWARVRITTPQTRVVAVANLRAGLRLEAGDIRLEEARVFPTRTPALKSVSDCAGMLMRRYLPAGTPLSAGDLMEPNDVDRGDIVAVEVQSGRAILALEAEAQTSGRRGQTVTLRNTTSGKIFRAKISGKGRALLECSAWGIG